MKTITRNILDFQEDLFFFPIRSNLDYARLLAYSTRQLLLENNSDETHGITSSLKLIVNKMSRLFFYKNKKFFSVAYPFTILSDENTVVKITDRLGSVIDNKSVSSVIAILESEEFQSHPSIVDFYIEPNGIEMSGISLLEEILQFEPAYVRYDHDSARENGKIHPLHHLDINYSQCGTFKLGLHAAINAISFEDLHDIRTECHYLSK